MSLALWWGGMRRVVHVAMAPVLVRAVEAASTRLAPYPTATAPSPVVAWEGAALGGLHLPSTSGVDRDVGSGDDVEQVEEGGQEWEAGVWRMAVPKRKPSYRKKRLRQMNPLYKNEDLNNFYPCPKCDKGLLKLRHHLCPCDQQSLNVSGVVKVKYGAGTPTTPATAGDGVAKHESGASKAGTT